jgi:hypothetical protein
MLATLLRVRIPRHFLRREDDLCHRNRTSAICRSPLQGLTAGRNSRPKGVGRPRFDHLTLRQAP